MVSVGRNLRETSGVKELWLYRYTHKVKSYWAQYLRFMHLLHVNYTLIKNIPIHGGKSCINPPHCIDFIWITWYSVDTKCIDNLPVNSFNQNVFIHILHIVPIDCISINCPSIVTNWGNVIFFFNFNVLSCFLWGSDVILWGWSKATFAAGPSSHCVVNYVAVRRASRSV